MNDATLASLLAATLAFVSRLPATRDHPDLPPERLFRELREAVDESDRVAAENRLWDAWCAHPSAAAEATMERAISAISGGDFYRAGRLLDRLVAEQPRWAEAWNKRATLNFLRERDADSLADIRRTLEIEPRHFGALAGLGQIALRHGEVAGAVLAFERALALNPGLIGLREAVATLRADESRTLH